MIWEAMMAGSTDRIEIQVRVEDGKLLVYFPGTPIPVEIKGRNGLILNANLVDNGARLFALQA